MLLSGWLACVFGMIWHVAPTPYPHAVTDEQAHYSYLQTMAQPGTWWPDFKHFLMVDAQTNQFTAQLNYLNHPPSFYWLGKPLPHASITQWRALMMALFGVSMAFYSWLGYRRQWNLGPTVAFALLPIALLLPLQYGFISNDSVALLGGMLVVAGLEYAATLPTRRTALILCIGLALCSVKLTAFLLVGFFLLAYCLPQSSTKRFWVPLLLTGLVLATPYLFLWLQYSSPAPNTPGQIAMLQAPSLRQGMPVEQLGWFAWLRLWLFTFANQYSGSGIIALPVLALFGCLVLGAHQPGYARAALLATLVTLSLHLIFSWPRYRQYAWFYDACIRYYFPLLPAYAISVATLIERWNHHATKR